MPRRRPFKWEVLEDRQCLTTWAFVEHPVDLRQSTDDAMFVDLNGDTRDDLVVSLSPGIGIRLAKADGYGLQDTHTVVNEGSVLGVADMDGDSDLDVIGAAPSLFWLENQNGASQFVQHEVPSTVPMESITPNLFHSGDINGDGKLDWVYLANSKQLVTILDALHPVTVVSPVDVIVDHITHIQAINAKGDDADEVILSGVDLWYAWDGSKLVSQTIPPGLEAGKRLYGDLDRDGLLDVIALTTYLFAIYELRADEKQFVIKREAEHMITASPDSVATGDFNGDGRTDIFLSFSVGGGGEGLDFYVLPQLPSGEFGALEMQFEHFSHDHFRWQTADIGGTGRDEFLFFDSVGGISSGRSIADNVAHSWPPPARIKSGDLDGDGDLDLVALANEYAGLTFLSRQSWNWYENVDGKGNFGPPRLLIPVEDFGYYPFWSCEIVDWDHDGLQDIVAQLGSRFFWYKNQGQSQRFAKPEVILFETKLERDFAVTDLDQDGLLELICHFYETGTLAKLEQLPGSTRVGPAERIASSGNSFGEPKVADINSDGMLDIVVNQRVEGRYSPAWLRNKGDGTLDVAISMSDSDTIHYDLADYDQDGDLDLLTLGLRSLEVRWHVNAGIGVFAQSIPIPVQVSAASVASLHASDLDRDGDVDLVVSTSAGIYSFENQKSQFDVSIMPSSYPALFALDDMNGDGQLDLLVALLTEKPGLRWYERRVIGDVNGDGRFNSSDLVELFIVNQFEDTLVGNSTFLTGDFNGDGEFNTEDLITAFQAGIYSDS